jgi:hypothetical protein
MLSTMDDQTVAEALPSLYRAVLDAVASLERAGYRPAAAEIRAAATRAYSGAWNDAAARRLEDLRDQAERVLSGRPAGRWTDRRHLLRLLLPQRRPI